MLRAYAGRSLDPVLGKDRLNFVPQWLFDNGRMFSRIGIALMAGLTTVDSILKHQIERTTGE